MQIYSVPSHTGRKQEVVTQEGVRPRGKLLQYAATEVYAQESEDSQVDLPTSHVQLPTTRQLPDWLRHKKELLSRDIWSDN